jgi:hypothetical protein
MVDAIWAEMGLLYPPKVEPLPKQAKATVATATRLCIRLPDRLPSWCLLHEIAHAMTTTVDGQSDGHGAAFMGVYLRSPFLVKMSTLKPSLGISGQIEDFICK